MAGELRCVEMDFGVDVWDGPPVDRRDRPKSGWVLYVRYRCTRDCVLLETIQFDVEIVAKPQHFT